ncbi:MAG: MerR family transcriptional regulator [Burkholderiales bacterium]|nr:MerR family transcriptional regulator [Burkholderiales bacterium]MBI3730848.1 MerR family transcriptional regulator [Burkholderiales bacterium]
MIDTDQYTIGQLAKAAGVGVETIRYYQRRDLLPVPEVASGFRTYPANLAERIRFIKRAQELGFSLDEIANLLMLEGGNDRQAIRDVAHERLLQVRAKLADLHKMEDMLTQLIHQCASSTQQVQCPIIQALASSSPDEVKACQH